MLFEVARTHGIAGTHVAALEALGVIGDGAAIPSLRKMIDRELDGRLRRRGKEVIRDLEEGSSQAEDVRRLRDEVGELRSLASGLRERLELIEATEKAKREKKAEKKAKKKAKREKD